MKAWNCQTNHPVHFERTIEPNRFYHISNKNQFCPDSNTINLNQIVWNKQRRNNHFENDLNTLFL